MIPKLTTNPGQIIHFKVVGLVTSGEFQKAKLCVERFHKCYPKKFTKPEIRTLMSFDWYEFLLKHKRRFGGKYYEIQQSVVVYVNDEILGDSDALNKYVFDVYNCSLISNYVHDVICHLKQFVANTRRTFVYLTIAIDTQLIGNLIFMLYSDLLPQVCENFVRLCKRKKRGYLGSTIHRICKSGWIQCGGWDLKRHRVPCEGYCIAKDRRGVLCMCNNEKHHDNSTQFFVTLGPAQWMEYYYVGFGQLVDGEETLKQIEEVPTTYEAPLREILIVDCGIYLSEDKIIPPETLNILEKTLEGSVCGEESEEIPPYPITKPPRSVLDERDAVSELNMLHYAAGEYFHEKDKTGDYLPKPPPCCRECNQEPCRCDTGLARVPSVLDPRDLASQIQLGSYLQGKYFHEKDMEGAYLPTKVPDVLDLRDVDSEILLSRYLEGKYFHTDDITDGSLPSKVPEVLDPRDQISVLSLRRYLRDMYCHEKDMQKDLDVSDSCICEPKGVSTEKLVCVCSEDILKLKTYEFGDSEVEGEFEWEQYDTDDSEVANVTKANEVAETTDESATETSQAD